MKDLTELRKYLSAIPSTFASNLDGAAAGKQFDKSSSDGTADLVNGFPAKYATAGSGNAILRTDFNKFGDMATRELHYREAGGVHTFNSDLSASFTGYPKDVVLMYDDGEYVTPVESEISNNTVNFVSTPVAIDNYTTAPDAKVGDEKVVVWKTSGKTYGVDEDLFRVGVDFSRVNVLKANEELTEDSLVVIGYKRFGKSDNTIQGTELDYMATLKGTVTITDTENKTITLDLENRGKHGMTYVDSGLSAWVLLTFRTLYAINPSCGCANYAVSFFAKKGWKVSVNIALDSGSGSTLSEGIYAFPLKVSIGEQE